MIITVERGKTECGHCPYFVREGIVECIGGQKRMYCRQSMERMWFDCKHFDVRTIRVSTDGMAFRKPRKKRKITSPVRKENSYER